MTPAHTQPLSLGFIGGGLNSAVGQSHFSACQLDGRWRLVAGVFSEEPEQSRQTAKTWNVPLDRIYENWLELIEKEAELLDAVVVLTPTPMHAEMVCKLLENNIPVICEKALACSPSETAEIGKIYNPEKHFLVTTLNYSGYPMVRELRKRIENGEFGQIRQIQIEMPQEGFARPPDIAGKSMPPQSWRLVDGQVPTICLDLGVHLHHMCTFLTGHAPLETMADFSNFSTYKGLVDDIRMWVNCENDMKVSMWMCKTSIGNRNGLKLRVLGEKACAEWYQAEPEEIRLSYLNGDRMIIDRGSKTELCHLSRYNRMKAGHPSGFIEAFANLYTDIADALIEFKTTGAFDHDYIYGLAHAHEGLELFAAARQSDIDKSWVQVRPARV